MLVRKAPWKKGALSTLGLMISPLLLAACAGAGGQGAPAGPAAEKPPVAQQPGQTGPKLIDTKGYAALYKDMWKISEDGPVIPGLEKSLVPQGLAYWQEKGWLIVSNYADNAEPSVLTIVDADTGAAVKTITLAEESGKSYTGHAGGVAVSARNAWIASGGNVYRIPLQELANAADGATIKFADRFVTPTRASFNTYAEGVLWVGEFALAPEYPTDPSHRLINNEKSQYNGWVVGYVLDKQTDQLPEGTDPAAPDFIFSIPDRIQGMAVTPGHVILSQSYGRTKDSALLKYDRPDLKGEPHTRVTQGTKSVPVWFLDRKNLAKSLGSLKAPPMTEGVVTDGGNRLFVLFESAAWIYRSTALSPMDRIRTIKLDEWNQANE